MKNQILAWHFLPSNSKTRYNNLKVEPGIQINHKNKIQLCRSGLHASVNLQDALSYAPGPILCRVLNEGIIIKGEDKLVSTKRTVLWMFDASRVLRLWGCWCIRNLKLQDGRTVWDLLTNPRSRKAIEVSERYAVGGATEQELAATWDAVEDAAWAATWDAARAAARASARAAADAARAATWDAARAAVEAARAATWDAARAAAEAARAAARAATWDAAEAARAAARAADSGKQLEIMVIEEAKHLGIWVPDPILKETK